MLCRIATTLLATNAVRMAAVPVKAKDEKKEDVPLANDLSHYKCKLSELPIYKPLHSQTDNQLSSELPKTPVHDVIESYISVVRKEGQSVFKHLETQKNAVADYYDTAKAHTMATFDYLNEPQNVVQRSGAIAIGGVAGLIAAVRGGFIKKVLYTSIGASTVAAICYPRQAEQVTRDALHGTRKASTIVYNFVKGVKPTDEAIVEPFAKFPTSWQDLKGYIWDTYDDIAESFFPKK